MSVGPGAAPNAPNGTTALVLGILSVVICPLLGPVAWSLGRRAEQSVDESGGALGGRGVATAGKVLGIIGTIILALIVLAIVIAIVAGGEIDGGFTFTSEL